MASQQRTLSSCQSQRVDGWRVRTTGSMVRPSHRTVSTRLCIPLYLQTILITSRCDGVYKSVEHTTSIKERSFWRSRGIRNRVTIGVWAFDYWSGTHKKSRRDINNHNAWHSLFSVIALLPRSSDKTTQLQKNETEKQLYPAIMDIPFWHLKVKKTF